MTDTTHIAVPAADGTTVDGDALRAGMRQFATGVAIVTTELDGELHGMTISSFTAVSLDPPLISACFMPEARTAKSVIARGRLNVHVLAATSEDLCRTFAKAGDDHYAETPYTIDDAGLPLLDAVTVFRCDVADAIVAGDHLVVFGLVRDVLAPPEPGRRQPLIFWNGLLTEPHVAVDEPAPSVVEPWELREWESVGLVW